MKTVYKFTLNIIVNGVACNDIVYTVSTMAVSAYSVKTSRHYKESHICFIIFITSDYYTLRKTEF